MTFHNPPPNTALTHTKSVNQHSKKQTSLTFSLLPPVSLPISLPQKAPLFPHSLSVPQHPQSQLPDTHAPPSLPTVFPPPPVCSPKNKKQTALHSVCFLHLIGIFNFIIKKQPALTCSLPPHSPCRFLSPQKAPLFPNSLSVPQHHQSQLPDTHTPPSLPTVFPLPRSAPPKNKKQTTLHSVCFLHLIGIFNFIIKQQTSLTFSLPPSLPTVFLPHKKAPLFPHSLSDPQHPQSQLLDTHAPPVSPPFSRHPRSAPPKIKKQTSLTCSLLPQSPCRFLYPQKAPLFPHSLSVSQHPQSQLLDTHAPPSLPTDFSPPKSTALSELSISSPTPPKPTALHPRSPLVFPPPPVCSPKNKKQTALHSVCFLHLIGIFNFIIKQPRARHSRQQPAVIQPFYYVTARSFG